MTHPPPVMESGVRSGVRLGAQTCFFTFPFVKVNRSCDSGRSPPTHPNPPPPLPNALCRFIPELVVGRVMVQRQSTLNT